MTIGSPAANAAVVLSLVDVVLALYEAIDGKVATRAITLFTDDAVFDHPQKVFRGVDEIYGFLHSHESDKERHTGHVLHNVRVAQLESGKWDVSSTVFIYFRDAEGKWTLRAVERMRHILRSVEGQWRITARVIEPLERAKAHETGQ